MLYTIVVTYNAESYLEPCLASLANAGRVIVVDNASTDRTVEVIQRFPDYELIRSERNLGYAGGTNLGLARALAAGADHVLILDQDARLFPDTADKLVDFAEAHPDYGVVSPVHLAGDGRTLDPHCRRYLLQAHPAALDGALVGAPSSALRAPRSELQAPCSELRAPRSALRALELPKLNSAIWLFSRRCLETVGGFDPIYFQYSADMDYCYRLRHHGIKLVLLTDAFAVHAQLKTLSEEEERTLLKSSPRQQFSYEATEIKKPWVSFRREFVLTACRLACELLASLMALNFSQAATKFKVIGRLLASCRTICAHQSICRNKGAHWIGRA